MSLKFPLTVLILPIFALACSQNKLSERDLKRQEQQALMEAKKQELLAVAASYEGELTSSDGTVHDVKLNLEVKEVPEKVDGSIDPVLVPKLVGNLRFILGGGDLDYIDFPIQKADYSVQTGVVYLVTDNPTYKELNIQAQYKDSEMSGSWIAPTWGLSGTALLKKAGT